MAERMRAPDEDNRTSFGGGDDNPAFQATGDLSATVSAGVYCERLPVGNMSVGEIRATYRDRFDLDPTSQAVIDGTPVDDDTVVAPGVLLAFVNKAGEKGRAGRTGPGGER